jgi:glycosyltransferase involved in cell wall biosynthesis
VRFYEWLDRLTLPRMDAVVCVSEAQARQVAKTGVRAERLHVIRNAIRAERFAPTLASARGILQSLFTRPRSLLIGAAGRLSPEKGFDILVEAAAAVVRACPDAGFVLFGDGRRRAALADQIARLGLADHFVLAGFRDDLDGLLTGFDLTVLPSYTEGLPNVVLESFAAGVPVVATAVGGTPEVVEDSVTGYLVPAGQPSPLAERILAMLGSEALRTRMGLSGQRQVREHFTFEAQAHVYRELFDSLVPAPRRSGGAAAA